MSGFFKAITVLYAIACFMSFFFFINPINMESIGSMLFMISWFSMIPQFDDKKDEDLKKRDYLFGALNVALLIITIILYANLGIYNGMATATVMIFFTIICIFMSLYFRQLETTDKLEKIKEELQEDLELEQGHSKYLRGELREKEKEVDILYKKLAEMSDK